MVDPATGIARAVHMEMGAGATVVREALVTNVDRKTTLVTDKSALYIKVGAEFGDHQTMINSGREYVNKRGYPRTTSKTFSCNSSAGCAAPTFIASRSIYSVT